MSLERTTELACEQERKGEFETQHYINLNKI